MKFRLLIAMIVALTLTAMGCSSDSDDAADDPAAVLADYLEVWNAEDAEAVMVFYAEDAVIEGHPEDSDGLATGKSEILPIEVRMQGHQGSTGVMEFIDMEVSGDTVTFDNIFHNGDGDCFSSTGDKVTVADDKITLFVFGALDADLC
jgi:ketosteroid isomerase-like protein